jgi:hypothetical protein
VHHSCDRKFASRSPLIFSFFHSSSADIKEAALCVTELKTPSYHPTIVATAINLGFEGKDRDRELVGKLLPGLVAQKAISAEELEKGYVGFSRFLRPPRESCVRFFTLFT